MILTEDDEITEGALEEHFQSMSAKEYRDVYHSMRWNVEMKNPDVAGQWHIQIKIPPYLRKN